MKHISFITATLFVVSASSARALEPANPKANIKAHAILNYLERLPQQAGKRLLSGRFTDAGPTAKLAMCHEVHEKTGHWPAMIGLDYADFAKCGLEYKAVIVCLLELKAKEAAFPHSAIREAGYHAAVFGQPTFNGVGILSRIEPQNVRRGMDGGAEDPQARFITAQVGGIQVISAYVPNGQVVGSAHYACKLDWLRRLRAFLEKNFTPQTPLVVCGDFNVARDELDVADPAAWEESVLVPSDEPCCAGRVARLGPG